MQTWKMCILSNMIYKEKPIRWPSDVSRNVQCLICRGNLLKCNVGLHNNNTKKYLQKKVWSCFMTILN